MYLRNTSTDRSGGAFSQWTILQVWNKGRPIPGYDRDVWRHDTYGSVMRFQDYGNTDSEYGWEIDHIYPVAQGGSDDLSNLQPLFWKNNRSKGDKAA
jgi:5-methylcytosine-specific restriction endonuclease McrA